MKHRKIRVAFAFNHQFSVIGYRLVAEQPDAMRWADEVPVAHDWRAGFRRWATHHADEYVPREAPLSEQRPRP